MTRNLIAAGLALLVALGIWAYLATHERVTETVFTGFRGEARVNDFKAAEMLLAELGIEAESMDRLEPMVWLPDHSDTIFTRLDPEILVPGSQHALIDWVHYGGHLVALLPGESSPLLDDFLQQFGVYAKMLDEVSGNGDETTGSQPRDDADYAYTLDLSYANQRLDILQDDSVLSTVSDDRGQLAVRSEFGDGYVTLVVDGEFFGNLALEDLDHGRLLLDSVAGYIDSGKVWLVYDTWFAPLWQLIWVNAPYAVLAFLLLLAIALWSAMPAFGPTVSELPPVRRSIVEHIQAAGTFVWKQRGASDLGTGAARAVLHRAEARHPGISRQAAIKQAQLISHLTGIEAQVVLDALHNDAEQHHREFTQHMRTLQRIRKEL